jgi:hypothetical protein
MRPRILIRFVTQAAEDAVTFDSDPVAMAAAAHGGDVDAVANLTRAYAAIAVGWAGAVSATEFRPLDRPKLKQRVGRRPIKQANPLVIDDNFGRSESVGLGG